MTVEFHINCPNCGKPFDYFERTYDVEGETMHLEENEEVVGANFYCQSCEKDYSAELKLKTETVCTEVRNLHEYVY